MDPPDPRQTPPVPLPAPPLPAPPRVSALAFILGVIVAGVLLCFGLAVWFR
jgi:hypothetical protein